MLIEFIGLPTAGKTTVANHLMRDFDAMGVKVQRLRTVARKGMIKAKKERKYLQNTGGRTCLYGSTVFGYKNPDIFQFLSQFHVDHPKIVYNNLEFLSDVHFAQPTLNNELVIGDEGFMHRAVASATGSSNPEERLDHYVDQVAGKILLVNLNIPVRVAMRRGQQLRGQLPYDRDFISRDPVDIMREVYWLTDRVVKRSKAVGIPVVTRDARRPIHLVMEDMAQQVLDIAKAQPSKLNIAMAG